MGTPLAQFLGALKLAFRDLPSAATTVTTKHTLGSVTVHMLDADGHALAACVVAQQRWVDAGAAQLTFDSVAATRPAQGVAPGALAPAVEASPAAAPAEPPRDDTTRIHGLAVGDVITLGGDHEDDRFEVEVMGVDAEGFVWRATGADPRDPQHREDGDESWSKVERVEGNRWRFRYATDARRDPPPFDGDDETADDDATAQGRAANDPDADHMPPAALRQRVVILSAAGDWRRATKGLAAWSAEKTPGAGSQSDGALVMLHTPLLTHGDVAKLFARVSDLNRRVLDLGEVDAKTLHDCAPGNARVRARWNEKHPDAAVPAGGEPARPADTRELQVPAEVWQKHKSGLRDTSTGALHKAWKAVDGERVAVASSAAASDVRAYCEKHGLTLVVDGKSVSPRVETLATPAPKARAKKGAVA